MLTLDVLQQKGSCDYNVGVLHHGQSVHTGQGDQYKEQWQL